ncbi:nucleotide exchange factor GrpE [Deferribacteraceae bacterium V6Fe1]|nr:nucleotide exchange factor GrpE [Deferribacteraceae bacterium V6Fe1]
MSKKKRDEALQEEQNIPEENIQEEDIVVDENEDTEKILLKKEIESLKKEVEEKKEHSLRLAAELDNFRKRLSKETEEKLKYANQQIILDFLVIIDNLEMALSHIKESEEIKALKEGVELTLKQFKDTLAKYGAKEIETNIGDEFNPNLHDALMLDADQNHKNNAITLVMQKGYTLHDRVIRPTKVRVNKVENIEKEDSNG